MSNTTDKPNELALDKSDVRKAAGTATPLTQHQISSAYNELPYETRVIAGRVINQTRINQIRIDQQKARASYQRFMRETNEQISNLEQELKK